MHGHAEGGHQHEGDHGHSHEIPDPSGINLRTLAALGVSGGLVPCPEAIAILLLAISLSRILLGLSLILAFSLGLAFILIAIGMVMVQSKSLFARLGFLDRWAHAIPVVSAVVVLALGLGLTFGAVNNARALAAWRDPAAQPQTGPVFDLERARVLFVAADETKRNQLYAVPAAGGEPVRLTQEPQGVRDYSAAPDGSWLAYSAADESGGSNLWRLDAATLRTTRLLACPAALCGKMILSTDGRRALYSRLELESVDTGLGIPSVWWLDLPAGETGPVFPEADIPALNFDWSPRGTWLSYTSGLTPEIRIDNLQTGEGYTLATRTGGRLVWSPLEDSFLLVDIRAAGQDTLHQVIRVPAGEGEGAPLIDGLDFNEYDPAWSPDGEWVALVRAALDLAAGDEIWLVRPDGSDAHALTADADALHGRPVWSPDGAYLLFTYSRIGDPLPRIRMLELESRATRDVSANGTQPAWLP